jgi:pimeloyl-ACP methyl ester carboxylesterase
MDTNRGWMRRPGAAKRSNRVRVPTAGASPRRGTLIALLLGALLARVAPAASGPEPAGASAPVGPPPPALERRSVASRDGTRIAYAVGGRGAVTVVLVHGWSCNRHFFDPQLAALASRYRVVALDLAGHGASERRRGPITVDGFADDVVAVADREARGPTLLLVHSTGGRVASVAAKRLLPRLLGVVGVDTFQNLGRPVPTPAQIDARLSAMRADFAGDTRRYVKTFFQPLYPSDALAAWVATQMTANDPSDAIAASEAFSKLDATAAFAGFERPVVAINSDWVPTDYRAIRAVLPGFDLVILAGRGHFPNLDEPASFNPILLGVLSRIEAAAGAGRPR